MIGFIFTIIGILVVLFYIIPLFSFLKSKREFYKICNDFIYDLYLINSAETKNNLSFDKKQDLLSGILLKYTLLVIKFKTKSLNRLLLNQIIQHGEKYYWIALVFSTLEILFQILHNLITSRRILSKEFNNDLENKFFQSHGISDEELNIIKKYKIYNSNDINNLSDDILKIIAKGDILAKGVITDRTIYNARQHLKEKIMSLQNDSEGIFIANTEERNLEIYLEKIKKYTLENLCIKKENNLTDDLRCHFASSIEHKLLRDIIENKWPQIDFSQFLYMLCITDNEKSILELWFQNIQKMMKDIALLTISQKKSKITKINYLYQLIDIEDLKV